MALAKARLKAAGIPIPPVLITAEDVTIGKPDPQCYQLAAQRLGVDASECLVFEDADVGIAAAEASGASVIVVTDTHIHPLETAWTTISTYHDLVAQVDEDGFMQVIEAMPSHVTNAHTRAADEVG
jgi:sugar-phosphatase